MCRPSGLGIGTLYLAIAVSYNEFHCQNYYSANNFALKAKRKTLSANDVLSALEDMEFEHFVPELKECLEGEVVCVCVCVCACVHHNHS